MTFSVNFVEAERASAQPRNQKPADEYPLRTSYEISQRPLTSELVWKIAPEEVNPHRRRWALERKVAMLNLRAERSGKPKSPAWTIAVDGLSSNTTAYFRSEKRTGVYHPMSKFPCSKEPVSWFATRQGAQESAKMAGELWRRQVDSDRVKLRVPLTRITAPTREEALQRAEEAFSTWMTEVERVWRGEVARKVRAAEWERYLAEARKSGRCKTFKTAEEIAETFVDWESMMERPAESKSAKQMVRAPARRWNGRFTVRLNVTFDNKVLNGQFLIDTTSEKNLISPAWLASQGVNPVLIELKSRVKRKTMGLDGPQRITWRGKNEFARAIFAEKVEASGLDLAVDEFWLIETEVILPPQHLSVCCDGVLGLEFLRSYAVEFNPDPPVHIKLFERERFSLGSDVLWFEAATTKTDELVSASCSARSAKDAKRWRIPAVRWATGADSRLIAHSQWEKTREAGGPQWKLECAEADLAKDVRIPEVWKNPRPFPGLTAGIQFMGRGPFTLDLGNGRIWFSDEAIQAPYLQNNTGLRLDYTYREDGERGLRVEAIRPDSRAAQLAKEGLKAGMFLSEINHTAASELDLWEVERLLAGAKGDTVVIEWRMPQGRRKIVPLKVK